MVSLRSRLLLTLLLSMPALLPAAEELDRIAAVVNDQVITLQQLRARTAKTVAQIQASGQTIRESSQLQRQVLERMVLERIKSERAHQIGLRVEPEQINLVIDKIAAENHLTLPQLQQALKQQGVDFTQFRADMEREILLNQLRVREVDNAITITPREIDQYLQNNPTAQRQREYHLRHILLALPEDPTPEQISEQQQQAEQLRQQLQQGADFARLAIEHSDTEQAFNGGDLGWRGTDFLPTLFRETVLTLTPGQISPILRNSSGFHLLKLEELRVQGGGTVRQVHARHILLKTPSGGESPENDLKQRLVQIRERILQGESFADLARAHSEDPVSASQGGDLDWNTPESYVGTFRQQLLEARPRSISHPFKSEYGWHIVELLGWRDHDNSREVERTRAQQALKAQKQASEEESWLRRLRSEAFVEIRI